MTPAEFEQEAAFLAELEDYLKAKGDGEGLLLAIKAHAHLQLMIDNDDEPPKPDDPALCPSCGYRVGWIEQRDALLAQNERLIADIERWNETIAAGAAKAEQMDAVIRAARGYATHRHVVCMPCMETLKAALAAYDANQTPLPGAFKPGA